MDKLANARMLLAVAAMALIVIAFWVIMAVGRSADESVTMRAADTRTPSPMEKEGSVARALQKTEDIGGDTAKAQRLGGRIIEVPDTRLEERRRMQVQAAAQVEYISGQIEAALADNVDSAIKLATFLRGCMHAPHDEESLAAILVMYDENPQYQQGLSTTTGLFGLPKNFDSLKAWAADRTKALDVCQATEPLFDEELRSRIQSLAEAGHHMARFLFAMWPPRGKALGDVPDPIFNWLEYVELARAYSIQNAKEGEGLGLLALGLSYRSLGYFTQHNQVVGDAFLLAADLCGLPSSVSEQLPAVINWAWHEAIWDAAERIFREYCG